MQNIFLIVLLSLSGCATLRPFPAKYLYEIDTIYGVCGKYVIVDPETLQYDYVEDLPLFQCNGVFGFSTEDIPKVLDWSEEAIKKAKEHK